MPSRREAFLIHVLVWVVLAAAVGIGFYLQAERRSDTLKKIGTMTEQIGKLRTRAADEGALTRQKLELSQALEQDRSRSYSTQEMDPYRFGIIIKNLLLKEGLEISRYQTLDAAGQNLLEFAVSGSALGLARFLQQVSTSPKRWPMPFLSVSAQEGGGKVQAVLRIGYEKIEAVDR